MNNIDELAQKCAQNAKLIPDIITIKKIKKVLNISLMSIGLMGFIPLETEQNINPQTETVNKQVEDMQKSREKIEDFKNIQSEIIKAYQVYQNEIYPLNSDLFEFTDKETWLELTDELLDKRPNESVPTNANEIYTHMSGKMQEITITVRGWKGETGLEKENKEITIAVNEELVDMWKSFFEDIYNECPDFVISTLGGYRIDGTGFGQVGAQSGHDYGAAIDINASVNYFGKTPLTKEQWEKLPETRNKYEEIYLGSSVEKIADRYTLSWGGEWRSKKDNMHFSFIADNVREDLIKLHGEERQNYLEQEEKAFQEEIKDIANKYLEKYGMSEYQINFENLYNMLNSQNIQRKENKNVERE